VDFFLKEKLKEEPLSIFPVQKQTTAGQRTRFKAYVVIGDDESHIGLGWKSAKEVQGAIKGAVIHAKLNLIPVRKGYWGNKIGLPHTVPCKVTGKGGSVRVRLIPAPRGTGIVAAGTSKKVLQLAGIQDCYTSSQGKTRTRSNFLKATFSALEETYKFQSPDFWGNNTAEQTPFEKNQKFLTTGKE
jgi:ribosomal protein uS5